MPGMLGVHDSIYQTPSPLGWKVIWSSLMPTVDNSVQNHKHLLSSCCVPSTMLGNLGPRKGSAENVLGAFPSSSSCRADTES